VASGAGGAHLVRGEPLCNPIATRLVSTMRRTPD
jgi:hypothetical protein